jgi:hypothetical protein
MRLLAGKAIKRAPKPAPGLASWLGLAIAIALSMVF